MLCNSQGRFTVRIRASCKGRAVGRGRTVLTTTVLRVLAGLDGVTPVVEWTLKRNDETVLKIMRKEAKGN